MAQENSDYPMVGQVCPICSTTDCLTLNGSCCWSHHAVEQVPENTYRICGECGHVYTRKSLRRAYIREAWHIFRTPLRAPFDDRSWLMRRLGDVRGMAHSLTRSVDDIFFCQECVHDF